MSDAKKSKSSKSKGTTKAKSEKVNVEKTETLREGAPVVEKLKEDTASDDDPTHHRHQKKPASPTADFLVAVEKGVKAAMAGQKSTVKGNPSLAMIRVPKQLRLTKVVYETADGGKLEVAL